MYADSKVLDRKITNTIKRAGNGTKRKSSKYSFDILDNNENPSGHYLIVMQHLRCLEHRMQRSGIFFTAPLVCYISSHKVSTPWLSVFFVYVILINF